MVLTESLNSRIEPLENHLKDIGENLFFLVLNHVHGLIFCSQLEPYSW